MLEQKFDELIQTLSEGESKILQKHLKHLAIVLLHSQYDFVVSALTILLQHKKISLDDYYEIRDEYLERNMFLYLFEIFYNIGSSRIWRTMGARTS